MADTAGSPQKTARKTWNFTPDLPIKPAPYWDWPLKPLASVVYLLKSWNPLGTRLFLLLIAAVSWLWFTPDLARARTIEFGWIFEVLIKNIILENILQVIMID